jgi:hypothetical protein
MPLKPPLLVRAARTRVREDRLTELLSVVLAADEQFAHRFLAMAEFAPGLPEALGPVEVSTQVRTGRGKRVDMEVLLYDVPGNHPVARLWSEHKTGSKFSDGQLPGYADELSALPGRTRLIAVTDRLDEVEIDSRWDRCTWAQLANIIDDIGRSRGEAGEDRRRWRAAASRPAAPAEQRLLHELLSYLEEDRSVVLDPLTHLDIVAFQRANRTAEVLLGLLNRAGEYSRYTVDGEAEFYKDDQGFAGISFSLPASWVEALEGAFELLVADEDELSYERVGEPAFTIGAWLPPKYEDVIRSDDKRAWRESIETDGFTVGLDRDGYPRITRTRYTAELLAHGPLLDSQARALAEWVDGTVGLLLGADPGLEVIPDPVRTRRRKRAGDSDEAADDGAPPTDVDGPASD